MNTEVNQQPIETQWGWLLAGIGFLMGLFLRAVPVWRADFPLLDGGMFYVAIESINNNAWVLPNILPYNFLDIPFAYPPLAFYVVGLITKVFPLSTLQGVQYLPFFYSVLLMVVMYFLAQAILNSPRRAGLATAIYAVVPRSFEWIILGGGVTRAPGILFSMLTILNAYRLFYTGETRRMGWVILFGALAVLSHPDAAVHTVPICVLLWLFAPRKIYHLKIALGISVGVILITSPWWGMVLMRYGFSPFLAASETAGISQWGVLRFLFVNFAEEPFLPILTLLAFLGMVASLYRKNYLLPIWFFLPFLFHPRSASTIAVVPLAMLTSIFINDVFVPSLASLRTGRGLFTAEWDMENYKIQRLIVGVMMLYSFTGTYYFVGTLSAKYVLPPLHRQAMTWADQNTPAGARFLILTGEGAAFQDPIQEWFPALTQRESVTTAQGREWRLDVDFDAYTDACLDLQVRCIPSGSLSCLDEWRSQTGLGYDYIYVAVNQSEPEKTMPLLRTLAETSPLVFHNENVQIFQVLE